MSPLLQNLPSGVDPAYEEFQAKRGETFKRVITLYEDDDQTKAYDLTGLVIKMFIEGLPTLVIGSGLLVSQAQGKVFVKINPDVTISAPEICPFYVEVQEGPSEVAFPLEGKFQFTDP